MRTRTRMLLAVFAGVFLLGEGPCFDPPDYSKPGEFGNQGASRQTRSRYTKGSDPAAGDCGPWRHTFAIVRDGVTCDASYDFQPLVQDAVHLSKGILATKECPKDKCGERTEWTNAVITDCERQGTRARARLEIGLWCTPQKIAPPPQVPIPTTGPIGESRADASFPAPWDVHHTFEEVFGSSTARSFLCDEILVVEYREPADCTKKIRYQRLAERGAAVAAQRVKGVQCNEVCERRKEPLWIYHTWGCDAQTNQAFVEHHIVPCKAKGS